jgi:N-carbamoylputrescine amidase
MGDHAGTKSLHVAAVQMASLPGAIGPNLEKAGVLIESATAGGAELVLLPELMASGYRTAPDIWETAEPVGGPVSTWLCETAKRHHIHAGTTILEVNNGDFYNTFLLATPQGELAGTVRKSQPAWVEARFYRGARGPHILETAIGRIGVGICYENYLGEHVRSLAHSAIDLLLQPTAAATPPAAWPVGKRGADAFDRMLRSLAQRHASMLGVPVIMSNMCGPLSSPLPGPFGSLNTSFAGLSSIVDAAGDYLAILGSEEGVIAGTVLLGGSRNPTSPLPSGRWSVPMPWYAPIWPLVQGICARAYERDTTRETSAYRLAKSADPAGSMGAAFAP